MTCIDLLMTTSLLGPSCLSSPSLFTSHFLLLLLIIITTIIITITNLIDAVSCTHQCVKL